jgi:hypothetical protein
VAGEPVAHILALVALRYVDESNLSNVMKWLVRGSIPIAAILVPAAFFLSVLSPDATASSRGILWRRRWAVRSDRESIPQLQPERQDVQPQRIIDPPHVAFLPLPQGVPQSTGAKGITVESRAEPEITNSTCYAAASAVRQDHPEAWPSWTLRALGHEGTKCWYPTTRTLAHAHPK